MPLRQLMRGRFTSNSALAREVLRRWRKIEPGKKPKQRSLAAKLSLLDSGDPKWWRNHPRATKALAQALETELSELGLEASSPARQARQWEFIDFPELRRFDPMAEAPLDLCEEHWFPLHELRERPGALANNRWIEAPPGSGKSFMARWHLANGYVAVLQVETLARATALLTEPGIVMVDVHSADPDQDANAFERIRRRPNLIVLAPYPQPVPTRDVERGRALVTELFGVEPTDALAHRYARFGGGPWVSLEPWRTREGWRVDLVRWLAKRIEDPDSLLDSDSVIAWLEANDPEETLFRTPGDVLPLCALSHRYGRIGPRSQKDFVAAWLGDAVARAAEASPGRAAWLKTHAPQALRSMVASRLRRVSLPWNGPLDRDDLGTLLPGTVVRPTPATFNADLDSALDDLACSDTKQRVKLKDQAKALVLRLGEQEIVEILADAGVLRRQESGRLDTHPRLLAEWIGAEEIAGLLEGDSNVWGRLAVSHDRRPLVDRALDHLADRRQFEALIRRAVRNYDHRDLGTVAACEALFSATGRRLTRGEAVAERITADLWEIERESLARYGRTGDLPWFTHPLTRYRVGDAVGQVAWVADCWAWSLRTPLPRTSWPESLRPLFPGWWPGSPFEVDPLWDEPENPLEAPPPMLAAQCGRLLDLASELVARARVLVLPTVIPQVLLPAALIAAPGRGWTVSRANMRQLADRPFLAQRFRTEASKLDDGSRRTIAAQLWHAANEPANCVADAMGWLGPEKAELGQPGQFDLRRFVLENLTPEAMREALRGRPAGPIVKQWRALPRSLRPVVAEWLVKNDAEGARQLQMADDLDEEPVEVLETLATHGYGAAIRSMWQSAPKRVLELLPQILADPQRAPAWARRTPPRHLDAVLGIVEQQAVGDAAPAWLTLWLKDVLPLAGDHAARAFKLLAGAP